MPATTTPMKSALAGLCVLAACLCAPARAEPALTIKFSHVLAPETPKGKAADLFKALVEERSGRRILVEIYPHSQLYKDKEELEALQLGAVQMLAPALSKFGPLGLRDFEIFDLPYLFDNEDQLHRVVRGPIGRDLLKKLESKGAVGLAYWDNGFKQMTANKPLRLPEDARGLKLRIPSSKVLEAQMRTLGALPQTMAFSEVYQALQTGVVDGTENTASNTFTGKAHEVQKYMTMTDHGYLGYVLLINKPFWEGLSPDQRALIEGAARDATQLNNDIARKDNDDALAALKASGRIEILVPTGAEKAAWKKALVKTHADVRNRLSPGLIESVYQETGYNPAN